MKIEDIKIGQKYQCPFTGNILLGIGMRKLFTDREFTEKHLVIIESKDPDNIGLMAQEGENAHDVYWEMMEEYDPENISRIFMFKKP